MVRDVVALADLCDSVGVQVDPQDHSDAVYVGLEHVSPGRVVRSGGGVAADVQSAKHVFEPGDVLYGKLRPYLDKAVLADVRGICTTELLVFRPRPDVDPRFLVSVLHSARFVEHAVAGTTGVQHPRTSWQHIATFPVPGYSPEEQSRIADLLWLVHDAIAGNEAAVQAGRDLKQVATRLLFTCGLRGEDQRATEIGLVPASWEVVPLGSLGKIGNGSTPKRSVEAYWNGGTFPWLTSAKVYDREIEAADEFVTEAALDECHLPRVQPGAVLMAITGQGKTLGHCAVLNIEATVNQHLAYLQTDRGLADPGFVRGYLETQYDYLRRVASGGGSTKGALTCAFLRQLPVPLPTRLDEQAEIVEILEVLDRTITLHRDKTAVLDDLFKAAAGALVAGELDVDGLELSAVPPITSERVEAVR